MESTPPYGKAREAVREDRDRPRYAVDGRPETKSLGRLFGDLSGQVQALVRLEVQLAKTELVSEIKSAGRGIGLMAGAGTVAFAALLVILMAVGFLLGSFMPDWLGFMISGLLALVAAGALASAGRKALRAADFKLDRTSRTLEEDALWLRQETGEIREDPRHLGSTKLRP